MKKYIAFICAVLLLISCMNNKQNNIDGDSVDLTTPICPKNHTDSIIPIVYGMPSEELFIEADSGLVWLGGCEVTDDDKNWRCKKHNISF